MNVNPGAVTSSHRQVLHAIRSGEWKIVERMPVQATTRMLETLVTKGWIARRGAAPKTEIKITDAGLAALMARV